MNIAIGSAFVAGFLASLSPCVYPMIPITLGYFGSQKNRGKFKIQFLLYFLGQVLAFSGLAIVTVWLGETLGFTSESRWGSFLLGTVLIILGLVSWFEKIPVNWMQWTTDLGFSRIFSRVQIPSVMIAILTPISLGIGSSLMASPCTTPILSGVLTLISQAETFSYGVFLILSYSLGFSLLLAILSLGMVQLKFLPRSGRWLTWVQKGSSLLLIGAGVYFLI